MGSKVVLGVLFFFFSFLDWVLCNVITAQTQRRPESCGALERQQIGGTALEPQLKMAVGSTVDAPEGLQPNLTAVVPSFVHFYFVSSMPEPIRDNYKIEYNALIARKVVLFILVNLAVFVW